LRERNQLDADGTRPFSPTLRDLLAIGFRQRRLIAFSFLAISLAVVLYTLLRSPLYKAQMKIMVQRERVDPMVTSEEKSLPDLRYGVTEQEINSEMELLKSRDLLEKVVISTDLDKSRPDSRWTALVKSGAGVKEQTPDSGKSIAEAVLTLERVLQVEPLKKSDLIKVTYVSPDPKVSARVLNTLADLYLEKHLAVHRTPGAFDFFQQQAERYRKGLDLVQARLADVGRDRGIASVQLVKGTTLQKLSEFEATSQGIMADIATVRERIRDLEAQATSTPPRITTQVHTSSRLLEQLQSTLLTLELKRTELMGIYQPDFPAVGEVQKQIAETRAAIAASQKQPYVEETTDRDPTHEWLRTELSKAKSEFAALQGRSAAITQSIHAYREKAIRLERMEMVQQDLLRDAKLAEQNYMVYFRKQEEARISTALDRQRILNVAIAEAATVPFLPSGPSKTLLLVIGALLASVGSLGLALVSDYWDSSFRTPHEVEAFLNVPVAAAMPKNGR
jgi:uncharacterized protein involved in exopolysaccharide biosynthesis